MTMDGIFTWGLVAVAALLVAGTVALAAYHAVVTRRIARHAREAVPPPGRFIDVGDDSIHVVEEGEGRPILFIHGLGGTLFHFTFPLFGALRDEFRLIALDRPGSGYSERRGKGPASPREQARFIADFIDAAGLERPLVVGHSLGGAIALALALDHPDKIAGLALISPLTHHTAAIPPEFAALHIRSPLVRRIVAETIAVPLAVRNRDRVLGFVFGPNQPPDDYAIAGGAMLGLLPGHFFATSTDFVAIGSEMQAQENRYSDLSMPVGVLFGTHDRVLDPQRHGHAMAEKVPGLELELLEGVGHMPQYIERDRVAALIRRIAARAFDQAISTDR